MLRFGLVCGYDCFWILDGCLITLWVLCVGSGLVLDYFVFGCACRLVGCYDGGVVIVGLM